MTRLAISIGCPAGIGPEVSVVAAARLKEKVLLVGDLGALAHAAALRGLDPGRLIRVDSPEQAWKLPSRRIAVWNPVDDLRSIPGQPSKADGAAQLAWIDAATDLVSEGVAEALVTGPVSKEAIARSDSRSPLAKSFLGHTEHLARRLRAREVTMAFRTEALTTSLVTTHLPLARVPRAVTKKEVSRAVFWTADFVARVGDAKRPVAVAALNPHAGEGGLLGKEESREIVPGIAHARTRLARSRVRVAVLGPIPAETAFRFASKGTFSAVVAMFHDQATIPMKLLSFGEAVNVSLGLPIIRTSVDHGTAYDRAGKGLADAHGMIQAIHLAVRLVANR